MISISTSEIGFVFNTTPIGHSHYLSLLALLALSTEIICIVYVYISSLLILTFTVLLTSSHWAKTTRASPLDQSYS